MVVLLYFILLYKAVMMATKMVKKTMTMKMKKTTEKVKNMIDMQALKRMKRILLIATL